MNIGFDAKRVFKNKTGLGNYSRNLIHSLLHFAPQHSYHLFTPEVSTLFSTTNTNVKMHTPQGLINSLMPWYWRSKSITNDLIKNDINLYHGLSFELPIGIKSTGIKTVVSVHDLIFERYPNQYAYIDRTIYRYKTKYACDKADAVAVMSEQTKRDLIALYHVPESKIHVTYQSCDEEFYKRLNSSHINDFKARLNLPQHYLLTVGSVIERKNLFNLVSAFLLLDLKNTPPLVVLGNTNTSYCKRVKEFIAQHHLQQHVLFLNDRITTETDKLFLNNNLPALYQGAQCLLYPSYYEGFGIPLVEAMASNIPIITSNIGCLKEIAGEVSFLIDPNRPDSIANAITAILSKEIEKEQMAKKYWSTLNKYSLQNTTQHLLNVYSSL